MMVTSRVRRGSWTGPRRECSSRTTASWASGCSQGGHSDGDPDTLAVAHREAEEETGLAVRSIDGRVLDVDIHVFPARGTDPAHLHYDVRFAFVVEGSDQFQVGPESVDLAWIEVDALPEVTDEESVLRMARKFADLYGGR